MQQQQQGPPIDLKNTSEVKNSEGGSIFQQGVILRTISKFITGTDEDALLPRVLLSLFSADFLPSEQPELGSLIFISLTLDLWGF